MDSSSGAVKLRACFVEEDQGLASLAEMGTPHQIQPHPFFSRRTSTSYRSTSFRALRSLPGISSNSIINHNTCNNSNNNSPRSGMRFFDGRFEDGIYQQQQQPHFLEACALCRKPLGDNRDIFMYRGDTPFCSEECRQEQIEIDEAKEKIQSSKALRKDTPNSTTPSKSRNYPFRTGTVAAA